MTASLDAETLHLLRHQKNRLNEAMAKCPPDRVLAEEIQVTIDEILDRRPRPHSIASDGEIVFDDQSPWVKAQSAAVNETGEDEAVARILPHGFYGSIADEEMS